MQFNNDIKKDYAETKESIRLTFPEAYDFLVQTENLIDKGFHIGTHKNLHLYFKTSFLFYFNKISTRVVGLSAKPNGIIKSNTTNNSSYFFDFFIPKLAVFNNDTSNTIEIDNRNGFKITINQTDKSRQFFKVLFDSLLELADKGNLLELSNEINELANEQQIYLDLNNPSTERLLEGIQKTITATIYERNPKARAECLKHWKYSCVGCGFNFEKTYGEFGKNYIHVHHIRQISTIKEEYEIDPIKDLVPVCPNCHSMIHRNKEPLTIDELKNLLTKNGR